MCRIADVPPQLVNAARLLNQEDDRKTQQSRVKVLTPPECRPSNRSDTYYSPLNL
jgi:hypothetical protein